MSSKGQNQLLQAAIRNRRQLAEKQQLREHPDRELPESVEVVEHVEEEVGPIAGPITIAEVARPSRSLELVDRSSISNQTKDTEDTSVMAAPLVNAPRNFQKVEKYKGNLLNHPSLEETLREYFDRVQVGEDRIVVFGAKGPLVDTNIDVVMNFLTELIDKMEDFNGNVLRGNRKGRYRILAKNKQ